MKDQAEIAYESIRKRLLSGVYAPGVRLGEQQLSEDIAVNRGAVRQALSRLYSEGLAVKGEKGGFFSAEFSEHDIRELYEVRRILEEAAVKLAAIHADEESLAELESTADLMEVLSEQGYTMGVYEADLKFHNLLVKAGGNRKLYELYCQTNIPLTGIHGLKAEHLMEEEASIQDAKTHRKIAELIRENRPEDALELLIVTD